MFVEIQDFSILNFEFSDETISGLFNLQLNIGKITLYFGKEMIILLTPSFLQDI